MMKYLKLLFALILTLTPTVVHAENKIEEAGTYFVGIYVIDDEGNEVLEYRKIHIKYPYTILDYESGEGIDARDIWIERNAISTLSMNQLISEGRAHAWSLESGDAVAIIKTELMDDIINFGSDYSVKYETAKGTNIMTSVYEVDNLSMNLDNKYVYFKPIWTSNFTQIAVWVILVGIIPLLIYVLLFMYIKKNYNQTEDLIS